MGKAIFDKTSKQMKSYQKWGTPSYDSTTEVLITVATPPDVRTDRWDDTSGVRAATSGELTTYDDNESDTEADNYIDSKSFKAIVQWLADKHSMAEADVRSEIITKYKAL